MKYIDQLFCASPASMAICSSTVHHSVIPHGGRRHVRRLGQPPENPKTRFPVAAPPCSSHLLPFDPTPHYQKSRKSTNSREFRRKSSAGAGDLSGDTYSPPARSSRYLLSDSPFVDDDLRLTNYIAQRSLIKSRSSSSEAPAVFRSPEIRRAVESPVFTPSHGRGNNHQVVELRVSIHCKGCEGKVRKHLSKMEGVTSFSIDLYSKKVTVIGDVTPVGVLASISKVKNAQFWPSPAAMTSSSSSSSASPRVSLH